MAYQNSINKLLQRGAERRYAMRCDHDQGQVERADSLREICRIANQSIPDALHSSPIAQDARGQLMHTAEQRAKDLIRSRILAWVRADVAYRDKLHAQMSDEWTQLTGALSHLRDWARQRLTATVQAGGSVGDAEG